MTGRITEADMLRMLRRRFAAQSGNGAQYAFIEHVRDAAGFDARRTIDAVAMSLWPSRGLELWGFEIKCSRADWLRELKQPLKAEQFARLLDRWWIVAADASVVATGELPPTWGLMVRSGGSIKTTVNAPLLPVADEKPFNARGRSFLATLLRSAIRDAAVMPEEVQEAVKAERSHQLEVQRSTVAGHEAKIAELQAIIAEFEQAAGVRLGRDRFGYGVEHDPATVGAALRVVLSGDRTHERLLKRFEQIAASADMLAEDARKAAGRTEA